MIACGGGKNGSDSHANFAVATSHRVRNNPSASTMAYALAVRPKAAEPFAACGRGNDAAGDDKRIECMGTEANSSNIFPQQASLRLSSPAASCRDRNGNGSAALGRDCKRVRMVAALGLFLTRVEVATAKFAWLSLRSFRRHRRYRSIYRRSAKLLDSVFASVKLQLGGYAIGRRPFPDGVSIGWSRSVATGCIQYCDSSDASGNGMASVCVLHLSVELEREHFLIALATGFPSRC